MCVTEVTAPRGTTEIGTVAAPAAFSSGALMPPRPSARSALATALGAAGAALGGLAAHDLTQKRHTILRIYPVIGHMRYLLEGLRPEIQQYFIERNWDGRPFDRDVRTIIYERAKGIHGEQPFGTERDVNASGYEYLVHSLAPVPTPEEDRTSVVKWKSVQHKCTRLIN